MTLPQRDKINKGMKWEDLPSHCCQLLDTERKVKGNETYIPSRLQVLCLLWMIWSIVYFMGGQSAFWGDYGWFHTMHPCPHPSMLDPKVQSSWSEEFCAHACFANWDLRPPFQAEARPTGSGVRQRAAAYIISTGLSHLNQNKHVWQRTTMGKWEGQMFSWNKGLVTVGTVLNLIQRTKMHYYVTQTRVTEELNNAMANERNYRGFITR